MTRAGAPNRIRFEIRVLGVSTAETFHVEQEVPDGWPLPTIGGVARPMSIEGPERRVVGITSTGTLTTIELEPIDCSFGEKDFIAEAGWLAAHGWVR